MSLPFEKFESWLGSERHLAPSTSLLYRNFVRALIRDRDTMEKLIANPSAFVARVAEYDSELMSSTRQPFRSAMRAFAQYLKAQGAVDITFTFESRRRLSPLGPFLRDFEAKHVPFNRIELIYWRDVRRMWNQGEIRDRPLATSYFVKLETIQGLNLWAGGGKRAESESACDSDRTSLLHTDGDEAAPAAATRGAYS